MILDISGQYWFAPGWIPLDQGVDFYTVDIESGSHDVMSIIPEFEWPAYSGQVSGLALWGALTDGAVTQLRGAVDCVVFGYRAL